ncbi:TPR-like protein [Neolentinus lepideus HHB14362 ss-1]|uniref:TPR-like protein n=1 Tax=Neolentinus lepideus HHB14362 ss-1 TaxID=1314782 RepID=A0A165VL90_9AGAM|nr:TPR-like protein [Neolentinus lepideus HHB14362 ss-1]
MVDRMRLWRHDAMMQHLYDTATFWGDKVLSFTDDPNDAFWLAQVHFMADQFSRAESLLTRPFPIRPDEGPNQHSPMNGHHPLMKFTSFAVPLHGGSGIGKGKGKEKEHTGPIISARLPAGTGGMIEATAQGRSGVARLVDMSVACRYLAAQCQFQQGKWQAAVEMLGEANPFKDAERTRANAKVDEIDTGIKVLASMCYLRGLLMQKANRHEKAKHCFMEALTLDVKCFEALHQLVASQAMTPDEEWEFIQNLPYQEQEPDDAEFIKLMYLSRLRKNKHAEEQTTVLRRLVQEYSLMDNPDILYAFADQAYTQFRWADCFAITSRVLDLTSVHELTLPLHLACMFHLKHLRSRLFLLAHDLVRKEPENAIAWYAVGIWYLTAGQYKDARQYFGKASLMDPKFSPAWAAFGHSFSLEGEREPALTAYATCARLYPGSHLPLTFSGMEHIITSNLALADECLDAAYIICDNDPLLLNEKGVMAYNRGHYDRAVELFEKAIDLAGVTQTSQEVWLSTYINLGTGYRKLARYEDAKSAYERVTRIDPRSAPALAFLGMTLHLMDDVDQAIVRYHEALSIEPMNPFVLELLNMALEQNVEMGVARHIPKMKALDLSDSPLSDAVDDPMSVG